jgi:large subunit ribosomal protein L5
MSYTPNLKNKYRNEIKSALLKEFQYKSPMQVPVLKKICINQGIGAAVSDKKMIESAKKGLRKLLIEIKNFSIQIKKQV